MKHSTALRTRCLQPLHIAGLDVGALRAHCTFGHSDRPQAGVMFALSALPRDGVCVLGRVGQDAYNGRGGRVAGSWAGPERQ
eukprot:1181188-Prorocentrum_minimum.AAC.1